MRFAETDKMVNGFGKVVVKMARTNLSREKSNASKTLWSSIRYRYERMELKFMMEYYGTFLDKGVSGTGKLWLSKQKSMPVPYNKSEAKPEFKFSSGKKAIGGNLKKWLSIRGIDKKYGYLIRRSIHARGIRPRRFFTHAFDTAEQKFNDNLNRGITKDVNYHVDSILKKSRL